MAEKGTSRRFGITHHLARILDGCAEAIDISGQRSQIDHLAIAVKKSMGRHRTSGTRGRRAHDLADVINAISYAGGIPRQRAQIGHLTIAVQECVSSVVGCEGASYNLSSVVDAECDATVASQCA